MRLSPEAAIGVCERAASEGVVVSRIEGGIWLNPGFESRLDCIWDGADPPLAQAAAHTNRGKGDRFIYCLCDLQSIKSTVRTAHLR
ncbi:hypothetical protein P2Q70_23480 [Pseudomonas mendocina]|uniref:hypothetical protein n=1 Tax=Ectopseudomonas mendocina TaxID=300 RepID=UPI0023DB7485|nr:hypothetical protein [Pseudomonas mendocina]MDF2077559.1 hypothetical protein [Pseudomonas mendocina]